MVKSAAGAAQGAARSATMPKLVATDLDGTLVHSDGTITARTAAALRALDERGVPVVFVTGRPLRWAEEVFDHVGALGLAIVSNGAMVWDVGQRQARTLHAMTPEVGLAVADRIREAVPGSTFAVETLTGIALEHDYVERFPMPPGTRRGLLPDIFDDPALKLLARHEQLEAQEFWEAAVGVVGDLVVITWSSDSALLEISAAEVTKAATLELLCAELGVGAAEVVAFGDMPNDIAMLSWAGASYAMADAHPTAAAAATHIAPPADEDGVAQVLEELFGLGLGGA